MENTIAVMNEDTAIISGINEASSQVYASFNPEDIEGKKVLYNAMSDDGVKIKSVINSEITFVDAVVMPVQLVDESTGEVNTTPRCILIGKNGDTYNSTSWGVYRSLQKINALFGGLHFDEGMTVIPKEVKTKKGFTINLQIV